MGPEAADIDLLRRYARSGDQSAFAEVVRRRVDLVYSAAARRVGDRHLAEDVTQAVFLILSRKAGSIGLHTPLAGWLLRTVRYAAANAVKIEARRRRHERKAGASMNNGLCSANPSEVLIWQEIAPQLDDAVLKLPSADRDAILMRYFEGRNTRELAGAFGVSEDAAKQRVSRAIERLRKRLCGSDIAIPSAAFTALISELAVRSAPAAVTTGVIGIGGAGVAASAGSVIAKGALAMMTWTKVKACAAALAVAAMLGTGGTMLMNQAVAQAPPKESKPAPPARRPTPAQPAAADPARGTVASAPPVVVKTVPEAGALDVDPKLTEIKVTFSKDMKDGNWAFAQTSPNTFPKTIGKPRYLEDQRTCVLTVQLEPGKGYLIWLNRPPYDSFMDQEGRKAVSYLLTFETAKQ